jgi:HD-GYP domain-containing protein (c-di-GMP phosphodiesterase class II)
MPPPPITAPRLAEVVAALSLATDFGTGHPLERALRTALLSVRFGESLGLDDPLLRDCYYVALLRFVGCTSSSHRADLFGDEIALGPQIDAVELWQPIEMLRFLIEHTGEGFSLRERARYFLTSVPTGIQRSAEAAVAHCEVSHQIAARLGFGAGVTGALDQLFERWDGGGVPGRALGDQITLPARLVQIAQDAELFLRLGGVESVVAVLRKRSGGQYDPQLVEHFLPRAATLLACLEPDTVWEAALAAEPGPQATLSDAELEQALAAMADFADLRTPHTVGHSHAVADLAAAAARHYGLPQAEQAAIRQAGLLHDIGTTGVSATIWLKPGGLTTAERERVRLHPYFTERILARTPHLAPAAALAALHHEGMDGTGYHRGLGGAHIPPAARILAAAEMFRSMVEARPYREAHTPQAAAEALLRAVRAGQIERDAAQAVLAAAGQRATSRRRASVAGLSEREVEVLRLVAHGRSNREMARALVISERTVDHHIRHIYAKIGVSTRAGAALFAMQHHLVEPIDASAEE